MNSPIIRNQTMNLPKNPCPIKNTCDNCKKIVYGNNKKPIECSKCKKNMQMIDDRTLGSATVAHKPHELEDGKFDSSPSDVQKKVKEVIHLIEEARKHPEEIEMVLKDIDSLDEKETSIRSLAFAEHPDKNSPHFQDSGVVDRVNSSMTHLSNSPQTKPVEANSIFNKELDKTGDNNPKLKFMCTCVEPRPCSHELGIRKKVEDKAK